MFRACRLASLLCSDFSASVRCPPPLLGALRRAQVDVVFQRAGTIGLELEQSGSIRSGDADPVVAVARDCQDAWLRSDTGGRLADSEAARHVVPILKGMQLLAIDGESVASMLQREQAKCPDLIRADPLTATLEACRARLGDCDTTSGASGTDPSPLVWHRPRIVVRFFPVSQYLLKCVPGARPVEFALCT